MKMCLWSLTVCLLCFFSVAIAVADPGDKKSQYDYPVAQLNFLVIKDANGKPVRNAGVVMHGVGKHDKQDRGGIELKTDADGKASFEGVPYGKLRVQVIAVGFQTYGEDFDIEKDKTEITIKMKRPQGQFSIYDDHTKDPNPPAKQEAPPAEQKDKKPN